MLAVLQFILLLNPLATLGRVTCFKPFYVTKMWEGPDNNDFGGLTVTRNRNVKVTLGKHALEEIEVLKWRSRKKILLHRNRCRQRSLHLYKKIKPRHLAIINGNDFLERKKRNLFDRLN